MSGVRKKVNHRAVFKPRTKSDDNAELSRQIILSARHTGSLNLSLKGLATVPKRVWYINELTEDELKELHFELDYDHKEERWWEQEPLQKLDLSCNSLTKISPKIQFLADLVVLHLHNNLLEALPREIGCLSKLKKLDLSCNKLEKLPVEFYNLTELCELNLRNNILKELDSRMGDLIMLTQLNLSHNNLTALPIGLGYLVRLISLDLSYNMIKELPPDMMSMRALKTLDASFNVLEILPPFGELRRIETVMLQSNKLTVFPDMSGCTALVELYLSDNSIKEIDMLCLENLGHLKKLMLNNNKIKEIPDELIQLISLEILDLIDNDISLVPSCIGTLPNLKQFAIDGNKIENVRQDIIRCGTPRILKHIRQTANNAITNVDGSMSPRADRILYPDKYTMKQTKLFTLAGQDLVQLPEETLEDAKFAEVTSIDFSRNRLCKLPDKLSEVITVTELKLTFNRLTALPEWIGEKYKYLQMLDLSRNCLELLPTSLGLLKHLREIDISFNRYTELPSVIYDISSLEILIANDNRIVNIDVPCLTKLQRLARLNLMNNSIAFVPPELGNLTNLRSLQLSGNCFKNPRQAVLMKSTEEILDYLRSRIST